MATLIVYPDAADLTVREINQIQEPTFKAYLDHHIPGWDKGPTGHQLKNPRFVATINGQVFNPKEWGTRVLLDGDTIDIVLTPKFTPVEWVMIVVSVISAAYSVYTMNNMNQLGSNSSTVPTGKNIYDINVQANKAELMGIRSQWFGRHQSVPSYLCSPYKYYNENNEQVLAVMLHVGEGYYQVSSTGITIANTPISRLSDDVDWQLFEPGDDVTTHEAHKNIYTAEEVGGTDSTSGLDFIGPSASVSFGSEDADMALILSDDTVLVQVLYTRTVYNGGDRDNETISYWKNKDLSWEDGTTFTITGISSTSVLIDDIVEIVDTGNDGTTGDPLPDKIVGKGFSVLSVGQEIQLSGAGSNDSTYTVATVSDTELTLKDSNGNDVTSLTPAASVTIKITTTSTDDGLYQVVSTDSDYKMTVIRVGDPDWTGFIGGTYSNSISLDVTSDTLPDFQLGPYVGCPEGYTTDYIEIDMLRSSGWGRYDSKGRLQNHTVDWEVWVRDADLGELDTWQVFPFSYTDKSYDQVGQTHPITLPSAIRPEVMLVRKTKSYDDTKYLDKLQWMRLKSKLPTASSYANSTVLAMSIRSDSNLSSSATNKIKVLQTRKLPVPDGAGGWTEEMQATRDIAPAIRYIVQNSGGSDEDIDMDELLWMHENVWSPDEEYFDGGFVDEGTIYSALKTTLQAGMAEFCFDIGKILPKRLFEKTSAGHPYTPDVMTGDGLTITTTLYDPDQNEGLIVYYMDPTDWTTNSVKCWLGDKNAITKWGELELTKGVTSRTRAWRIGMRMLRRSQGEKINYSFTTEMDALNSTYLDYAELCDDLPNFGQFGEVVDWQVVRNNNDEFVAQITVDRDLEWTVGDTHYMTVRRHDGTGNGPFVATKVSNRVVMLSGQLDFIPNLTGKIEPPLWLFGDATRYSEPAVITSITPNVNNDTTTCSVKATNYVADMFKDDANFPPDEGVTWWE
ncbi:host specificity factor TipJ family phage tail protein [Vibrio parahaemolyticus]